MRMIIDISVETLTLLLLKSVFFFLEGLFSVSCSRFYN